MTNRIHQLFQRKKGNILSIYFTAGYPMPDDTITVIQHLSEAGADMIEIGFPFSDPLADGPVIQQSSHVAIENGMTLQLLFQQLKTLRIITQIPVILMGYLNPVLQFGEAAFIKQCHEAGIDGVIIPDMPLSYYKTNWKQLCTENQLSNILLITPETTENRVMEIDDSSEGFIYMVSSNSITGGNKELNIQSTYFDKIKQMQLKNPTLIGFGIHDAASFDHACKHSSGAIIGSAFINHLSSNGISKENIQQFVKNIRP